MTTEELSPAQVKSSAKMVLKTLAEYFRDAADPDRAAIEFARAHAACTLAIPDMAMIEQLASEQAIVSAMKRDASPDNIGRLAELHGVARAKVRRARNPA